MEGCGDVEGEDGEDIKVGLNFITMLVGLNPADIFIDTVWNM